MCRIDAKRIVSRWAIMESANTMWNWSNKKLVRNPARHYRAAINSEDAISLLICSASPEDAAIRLFLSDVFEKAVNNRLCRCLSMAAQFVAFSRAKQACSAFDLRSLRPELRLAEFAKTVFNRISWHGGLTIVRCEA